MKAEAERVINKMIKEFKADNIDWNNTKQLAEDVWLFLTNKPYAGEAKIKKVAAIHEISAMIDSVSSVRRKEDAIRFAEWCDSMNNVYRHDGSGVWHEWDFGKRTGETFTTNELYEKYRYMHP